MRLHGGINYVKLRMEPSAAGYKTPSQWEAYSVVKIDQYDDVQLSDTYSATIGGVTAGAAMKRAA